MVRALASAIVAFTAVVLVMLFLMLPMTLADGVAKKFDPIAPFASRPRFCWLFMVVAMPIATRPSAFWVASSVSLRNAIRPPSAPPVTAFSARVVTLVPVTTPTSTRVWSVSETTAASWNACEPTTSGWPLPIEMVRLLLSPVVTLVPIAALSWFTSSSRASSRSFGWRLSEPEYAAICWFRSAIWDA